MCGFPTTCLEIQLLALVGLDVVVNYDGNYLLQSLIILHKIRALKGFYQGWKSLQATMMR